MGWAKSDVCAFPVPARREAGYALYLAQAELAAQILKVIRRRGLTQAAAGKLLGIKQPKVSALLNGRLDGFSSDRLFRFLITLGCDVRISISRPHAAIPGHVRVKVS